MPSSAEVRDAGFDHYAADYDAALAAGLRATGESRAYFAERRVQWLGERVRGAGRVPPDRVLDFGCGDGDAAPLLRDILGAREVVGVDVSTAMVARASARHPWARFTTTDALPTMGAFDLVHVNGVFHHIPVADRGNAAAAIHRALRPGGILAFWENHPWNPGTRWVMRRIEFDRDAILLSPPEARRLLERAGFQLLRTDHLFIFPASLRALRPLERALARLPIGGQYQVLAVRAAA